MDAANFKIRTELYKVGEVVNNNTKISINRILSDVENVIFFETLIDMLYTSEYSYTTEELKYIQLVINQLIVDDNNFYKLKKSNLEYGNS